MKIGVMADSHDNVPMVRSAVDIFRVEDVDCVIHAGDIVAPFAAKELLKFEKRVICVFGNNDGERKWLKKLLIDIHEPPHVFELGGRRVVLTHMIEDVPQNPSVKPEIVICGHTHVTEIQLNDDGLRLNPGECGGWLTGKCTVAILDTKSMDVRIVELQNSR
jgi:putative phosphoesterase